MVISSPGPKQVYFRFHEEPTKQPYQYYVAPKASTERITKAVRVHFGLDMDVEISFWSNGSTAVTPSYANLKDGLTYEVRRTSAAASTTPPLADPPPPVHSLSVNPPKHVKFYIRDWVEGNPFRCAVRPGDTAHEVVISMKAYFGMGPDSSVTSFCTTHGDAIVPDYDNLLDNMSILVFCGDDLGFKELRHIWKPYSGKHYQKAVDERVRSDHDVI
jgi:hypothetical protein